MSLDFGEGVGKVRIKVLSENTTDITLATDEKFKDKVQQPGPSTLMCLAEHGLAMLFEVTNGETVHTFLLDAGGILGSVANNIKYLQIDTSKIEKFVLSHGHFDHYGGLNHIFNQFSPGTEIMVAKNAFLPKWALIGDLLGKAIELDKEKLEQLQKEQKIRQLPALSKEQLSEQIKNNNLKLIETCEPIQLASGVWTSGEIEIPLKEELTKGLYIQKNGEVLFDDFRDEISVYINVKDKGLVILNGCGHTGIMNTVKMAQKLSGINKVYALIGGYHLNYASKERIDKTIVFLKKLKPEILCAMHCSGFNFTARLMNEIPESSVLGIVGTSFNL